MDSGSQVLDHSSSLSLELVCWILIVSGILDTLSCVPDSTSKNFLDSGFSYIGRVSFAGIFLLINSVDEIFFFSLLQQTTISFENNAPPPLNDDAYIYGYVLTLLKP